MLADVLEIAVYCAVKQRGAINRIAVHREGVRNNIITLKSINVIINF